MDPIATTFGMIRPWSSQDVDALVKYANNRKIWINMRDGFPYPYTREDARSFLEGASS
jgi:ribosomal-protein-alanine N-acetyltransferase